MKVIRPNKDIIEFNGQSINFTDFVLQMVEDETRFGKGLKEVKYAAEYVSGVLSKAPEFEVSEEAHKIMIDVLEHPKKPYNVLLAIALLPFIQALIET